jgi:hypothetical protein
MECEQGLTTYNPRIEVLRKLLDAGPRLVATYTWSQLQSKKWNSEDHTELLQVRSSSH